MTNYDCRRKDLDQLAIMTKVRVRLNPTLKALFKATLICAALTSLAHSVAGFV